jgi:hypothetical protein
VTRTKKIRALLFAVLLVGLLTAPAVSQATPWYCGQQPCSYPCPSELCGQLWTWCMCDCTSAPNGASVCMGACTAFMSYEGCW